MRVGRPLQAFLGTKVTVRLLAHYKEGYNCGDKESSTDPHYEADDAYDIRLPHLGFGYI